MEYYRARTDFILKYSMYSASYSYSKKVSFILLYFLLLVGCLCMSKYIMDMHNTSLRARRQRIMLKCNTLIKPSYFVAVDSTALARDGGSSARICCSMASMSLTVVGISSV